MGFEALKCPQCGADIEFDGNREYGFCQYCGTKIVPERQNVHLSGSVSVDRSREIESLLMRAKTLMAQGREEEARLLYEKVLETDGYNAEAGNALRAIESVIIEPNLTIRDTKKTAYVYINVKIDNTYKAKIAAGSSKSFMLPCGNHTVTISCSAVEKKTVPIFIRDRYSKWSIVIERKAFGRMLTDVSSIGV